MNKWDMRFIQMANTVALWSKDPDRKVGCIIVDTDFRKFSIGYNGFPKRYNDNYEIDKIDKIQLTIHAEINAILNCPFDTKKCYIYTNYPICFNCSLYIIQSEIAKVTMPKPKINSKWYDSCMKSEIALKNSNIKILNY